MVLLLGGIHWYGCLIVTALCSAAIEFSQYVLQCGFCDINDFMDNVLGSVIGIYTMLGDIQWGLLFGFAQFWN